MGVGFVDPADPFEGWSAALNQEGSWVEFDDVDFGDLGAAAVSVRVRSEEGGTVKVRVARGGLYASADVAVPPGEGWRVVQHAMEALPEGVQNVWISLRTPGRVEVDGVQFG